MIIKPKIRGFVCVTAHPEGCAKNIQDQINYVKAHKIISKRQPKRVLVIGASTGYGLSSRIAAAYGYGAETIGVCFERKPEADKLGSAGWYNTAAFEACARRDGLKAHTINGDAFSEAIKDEVVALLHKIGPVDCIVYSLASPRRTDAQGVTHKSVLKPIGAAFSSKNLDTDKGIVNTVTLEPATEDDINGTIKVMGGEDWTLWMERLVREKLLAPGAQTVAYSYIGPELTHPIYTKGTIGRAKADLEVSARRITEKMLPVGGHAYVAVNKAVVTQASSAIPVVPLYISILFPVMKQLKLHEGCVEQMHRLFFEHLYADKPKNCDDAGRIRLDDLEMKPEVQQEVAKRWKIVSTENLGTLADFADYQREFLSLFGFGRSDVNYDAEVDPNVSIPSLMS